MKTKLLLCIFFLIFTEARAAVILVGWDAADYRIVKELSDTGTLPNLNRLNWGHLTITSVTMTCPSWSEQLSGLPWYVIGSIDNEHCQTIPFGNTIFEWAKMFGLSSAFIVGKKPPISVDIGGAFYNINGIADITVDPAASIAQIAAMCLSAVETHDLVFCHFKHLDKYGHMGGMISSAYKKRVILLDAQLGRFLDTNHTILLTSDHGFEVPTVLNNVPTPVYPVRTLPYGMSHVVEPNAIIGSNTSIDLTRPIGLDVFPTLVDMLGLPPAWWIPRGLGKSLLLK